MNYTKFTNYINVLIKNNLLRIIIISIIIVYFIYQTGFAIGKFIYYINN